LASSAAAQPDERIEILDGLRGLAVLFVIGYHYFGQWAPPLNSVSLYPYGESLASVSYFRFGYLGVDLFFLVSGFVITLTLTRCSGPREFLARRFARLFPAMVLASSATFLIVRYLSPHFWTRKFCDFLPGLTFTDPWLFKQYVGIDCEFMDGAYWSLFVEVRFYFLVALLYFGWSRAAFLRNSAIFLSAAISVSVLEIAKYHLRGLALADLLLFPQYSPLLCCGIAFYFVWRDCSNRLAWFMVVEAFTASVGR
jgi:peptidoglycan/LPS O-acetylase OafA/YrhL